MPTYHNNKLTMVGLDSSSDENPYTPATALKPHKRKRVSDTKMPVVCDHDIYVDAPGEEHGTTQSSDLYSLDGEGYVYDAVPPFAEWAANPFGELSEPSLEELNLINYSSTYDAFNNASSFQPSFSQQDYNAQLGFQYLDGDMLSTSNTSGLATADATPSMNVAAVQTEHATREDKDITEVKQEVEMENVVSSTPLGGSEYYESDYDEQRPSKIPKLNKDGIPRKPRQPRPKLLKWDDNDWKNVALGLVWACGENGIQIPFDQASQIVSESCTAGALQQALLKLRGKQIAEGFQIPSLRMAWTRKNKNINSSTFRANSPKAQDKATGTPKKKPTRFAGNQSLVVTLKRAYRDADRSHIDSPHTLERAAALKALCAPMPAGTKALSSPSYDFETPIYVPMTPVSPYHAQGHLPYTPSTSPFRYRPSPTALSSSVESEVISHMRQGNAFFSTPTKGSNDPCHNRYTTMTEFDTEWVADSPSSGSRAPIRRPPPPPTVTFAPMPNHLDYNGHASLDIPTPGGHVGQHRGFTNRIKGLKKDVCCKLFKSDAENHVMDSKYNFNQEDDDGSSGGSYLEAGVNSPGNPNGGITQPI
jgi:hypothetical protein